MDILEWVSEGPEDDGMTKASVVWREAERAETSQSVEEMAQGESICVYEYLAVGSKDSRAWLLIDLQQQAGQEATGHKLKCRKLNSV